jgi:hypothetical protein
MLEELPWKHKNDWIMATRTAWKSKSQAGDKISGYIKEYSNLLVSATGYNGIQKL